MLWLVPLALAAPADAPNIVLVSMDTTRADALSCYQAIVGPPRRPPATPRLDAVAEAGVRFERFYATAPSTLSSHTTLLTGLDPHEHAVVRNGFPVSRELPTLPERLQAEGWDTIGVVAASALEASMGLDRGFRVYDDETPVLRGLMHQDSAEGVVRRVLGHVDARADVDAPLFLFVHFYDPHTPYVPPAHVAQDFVDPDYAGGATAKGAAFRDLARATRRGRASIADLEHVSGLYLAEVAHMDAQIGRLLDALGDRGLLERALLVFVADHGETLADDPRYAWSHGSNLDHDVVHVPLIVEGRGLPVAQHAVVARQASMQGLAGTIEQVVGLAPTLGVDHAFAELLAPGPAHDVDGWPAHPTLRVHAEATRPRHAVAREGWNNRYLHRAVWAGGWGAYRAPFLGLPLTFYAQRPAPEGRIAETLDALLDRWDADLPAHREHEMPAHTREALRALGYVED